MERLNKEGMEQNMEDLTYADLTHAHEYSINHRKELEQDTLCGCFHCLRIFHPKEITDWIEDTSGTAECPYCGIDSIIGSYSGYPITHDFLHKMYKFWF